MNIIWRRMRRDRPQMVVQEYCGRQLPDAVFDGPTLIVAVAALIVVTVTKIPAIWVILGGAVVTLGVALIR